MEAITERRTFDKVMSILKSLGNTLKLALEFGGVDANSLNRMKGFAEELCAIEESDFIGSWLKMPSNREILEVYVNEILQTYCYNKEVEEANFKPEQIGGEYVQIADIYDRWRNTIVYRLSECLPEGAALMYDYKKYVMFPPKNKIDKKENKGKGTRDISFVDSLLVADKKGLLSLLHKLIDGRKGKYVAKVIKACYDSGLMEKPTYTQVKNEFGDIGDKSGYNKYVGCKYEDAELKPIVKTLKGFL